MHSLLLHAGGTPCCKPSVACALLQDVRQVAARYKKSVESTGDLTAEDEDEDRSVMPKAIRCCSLDAAEPGLTRRRIAAACRRGRDTPSPGSLACGVLVIDTAAIQLHLLLPLMCLQRESRLQRACTA